MIPPDVNARSTDGRTPLMIAAGCTQSPRVITVLLDAEADATAKGSDGRTAARCTVLIDGMSFADSTC